MEIVIHHLRDFSTDKHRKVDDYPFGGEAGMVMSVQPIEDAIQKLKSEREYDEIIFTTPDAPVFCQQTANKLSNMKNLIILCGHYKGVDQRVRDHLVTMELSIGDYVLSGGELAAAVITDSIVRVIPGAISDSTSALSDSFQDNLLSPPVYTRPADYKGWKVPEFYFRDMQQKLRSGNMNRHSKKPKNYAPTYSTITTHIPLNILEYIEAFKLSRILYSGWIIKFESKARKNLKTQYTTFEELRILQQCSYRTLWTVTY